MGSSTTGSIEGAWASDTVILVSPSISQLVGLRRDGLW